MRFRTEHAAAAVTISTVVLVLAGVLTAPQVRAPAGEGEYRARLGWDNPKIRRQNGRTLLWARGAMDSLDSEWYDFTGAPIAPEELQYGIGKDRIQAIDDSLFVAPDDPRLLTYIHTSPYRHEEVARTNDEIMVIGYAHGGQARAYPTALLDWHELVNDEVGGRLVTVGW